MNEEAVRELIPFTCSEWVTTIMEWATDEPRIFRNEAAPTISEGNTHLILEWPDGTKFCLQAERVTSIRIENEVWTTLV